jgi:hypothetical protein
VKVYYILEIWDPKTRKYTLSWRGNKFYSEIMFHKSYNQYHTRRLLKITEEEIMFERARKKKYEI